MARTYAHIEGDIAAAQRRLDALEAELADALLTTLEVRSTLGGRSPFTFQHFRDGSLGIQQCGTGILHAVEPEPIARWFAYHYPAEVTA